MKTQRAARAAELRAEGMPGPWIAEDIDCTPSVLRRLAPASPEAQREWLSAWAGIRRDPALYRLHRLFTPHERYHRK